MVRETPAASGPLWHTVDMCERAAAVVLLAALSPVMAFSGAVVWVKSRRTPWIAHRRVGWHGKTLWMLKLRTMWLKEESREGESPWVEYIEGEDGAEAKRADDPRVRGRLAAFFRRHSIDELPQLWH